MANDPTEGIRRALISSGLNDLQAADAEHQCGWCSEDLYEFEGKWFARKESGLICRVGSGNGEHPEHRPGGWDTAQLQADFEVQGFMAPFVVVKRRSDGQVGTVQFRGSPRLYFGWEPDSK